MKKYTYLVLGLLMTLPLMNRVQAQCLLDLDVHFDPPLDSLPLLGPGTELQVNVDILGWSTASANWFHGISWQFGKQFDASSVAPVSAAASLGGAGFFMWSERVQSTAYRWFTVPGFFFESNQGASGVLDSMPGNNFGDNPDGPTTGPLWQFSVKATYTGGTNPGVAINTFPDSETGVWTSLDCTLDPVYTFGEICPAPWLRRVNYNSASNNIRLEWQPVEGARGHRIYGKRSGESGTFTFDLRQNFAETTLLDPAVSYDWSVATACAENVRSAPAPTSSFRIVDLVGLPPLRMANKNLESLSDAELDRIKRGYVPVDHADAPLAASPNPVELGTHVQGMGAGTWTWSLMDAVGRLSAEGQTQGESLDLDLSALPSGTYLLRLSGENTAGQFQTHWTRVQKR